MKSINDVNTNPYMQNMDWNTNCYLDIELIDKQHAVFFEIFNQLKELNLDANNFHKLKELIFELEKYTNMHFQTEEILLVKSKHSEIEMHIAQHQMFKKKIEEFKIAATYQNSMLIDQMIVFLRKWFLVHIAEVDRKYVDDVKFFINKNTPKDLTNPES